MLSLSYVGGQGLTWLQSLTVFRNGLNMFLFNKSLPLVPFSTSHAEGRKALSKPKWQLKFGDPVKDFRTWVITSVFYVESVKIAWCWKMTQARKKGRSHYVLGMLNITQCVVLAVQDFFSLSPSLKIVFLKPQNFVFFLCFIDKQSKYRNNLQRCSADIFASSVCVCSFQPKGKWSVCFVLQGMSELCFI